MKKLFQTMFIASIFTCTSMKSMEEKTAENSIVKKNELDLITGLIAARIDLFESVLTEKFDKLEKKINSLERDHAQLKIDHALTRNATIYNLDSIRRNCKNCYDQEESKKYVQKFNG